jgi:hypothetical protein
MELAFAPDVEVFDSGKSGKRLHTTPMTNRKTTMPWKDLECILRVPPRRDNMQWGTWRNDFLALLPRTLGPSECKLKTDNSQLTVQRTP